MAVSGNELVEFAKKFIGTPYAWGGNSLTEGIDCSGLVQQVYKHFGINVSRTTYTQIGEGKAVKMNELQPGDMVFFDNDPSKSGPDHVGIYIGDGKMIEAPRPGKSVQISDITSGYWQPYFMGGRRVSGIQGGGTASESSPEATVKLSPEEMASEYGWAYSFLQSVPELKGLFGEFVDQTWTKDKFQAKLRETEWWKTNSSSMRKAAQEKMTDPATYNAKTNAMRIQIMQLAAEMGASIPPSKLTKLAEQAVNTEMDEALLRNVLGGYISFTDSQNLKGSAGMFEHNMRQFADEQGITLDKQALLNQAQLVARGLGTEEDFRNQIVAQAASMYPAYTEQLMAGQTMKEIASPYMEIMSQDLEILPAALTLKDPLLKQALNGVNKQGKPTGMDLTTFQAVVRNDPRWGKSRAAQNGVMETGLKVLKDMGLIGGN